MKTMSTHAAPDTAPGAEYMPDSEPPIDFETARESRPGSRARVYSGTPEYREILRHKLIKRGDQAYYTNAARTELYFLHAPKDGETDPDPDGDGEGEGEQSKRYYFYPVDRGRGGLIRLVQCFQLAPEDRHGGEVDEHTFYDLESTERQDKGVVRVTARDLQNGKAWAEWGTLAITSKRDMDLYADLVKIQASVFAIPVVRAHAMTGFYLDRVTGENYYLLPDGRTMTAQGQGTDRPFIAQDVLHPMHARFFAGTMPALTPDAPAPDDLASLLAFYTSAAPNGHLLITVGAALRSLVHTLVPAATALVSEGEAESGKTSSQKHARGVYGPSPYRAESDGTFTGTATSLELIIAPFSDMPVVVDNFRVKPTDTPHDIHQLGEALDRICVSAESGGEMRARANRDATKRRGHTIKTLPLINGERLPGMLISTFRRIILLPYVKGEDINLALMRDYEPEMQPILTRIGHAIVRARLAARNDGSEPELRDRIAHQEDIFIEKLMDATMARKGADLTLYRSVPANWARVLTGLWLVEHITGASGYIDAALPHVIRYMNIQLDRMTGALTGDDGQGRFERLVRRFIEKISDNELITGQNWNLCDLDGDGATIAPTVAGTSAHFWGHHGEGDRSPVTAGYVSEKHGEVYLLPKTIELLCKMAERTEGSGDLITQGELWRAAEAEGWIARRDGPHRGVKVGSFSNRGWAIRLDKWMGRDDPDDAPAPVDPAPTPTPIQENAPISDDARRYLAKVGDPWNAIPSLRSAILHYAAIGSPTFTLEISGKPYPCQGDLLFDRLAWLFRQGSDNPHKQTDLIDYATRCIKTLATLAPAPHEQHTHHEQEETEMTNHA